VPAGFEAEAYYAGLSGYGRYSGSALSEKNVARAEVSAFGYWVYDADGNSISMDSEARADVDSQSYLEVRGGSLGDTVSVDVMYSLEIGIWRSPLKNIASANSLIIINDLGFAGTDYDIADSLAILWEAELDAHFASGDSSTSYGAGDEFVTLSHTLSLISGHDYLIELETLAEATAFASDSTAGWARAEAFADPTFSLATGNSGFSLNHFTPEGSATVSSVPVPATAWLFGSALIGLVGIKRKKIIY
jgi:hypothetical protein